MQIAEPLLGTRAEVEVITTSAAASADAEQTVLSEVARLERIFTTFEPSSALNQLRRTGSTAVPELVEVVECAAGWTARSQGAFDPRMQPLVEVWDRAERSGCLPSDGDLAAALETREGGRSAFDNLNAIAKGWIAQAALNHGMCDLPEVATGWLSLGGDIVHQGERPITLGIEDPHRAYDNVAPMATVQISTEAIATSGAARRWWTIEGRRYAKVLDPRTGQPADRLASATVIAPDAATADVLATIALVVETDEILGLVDQAGADCLLVHHDRSRTVSSSRFEFS